MSIWISHRHRQIKIMSFFLPWTHPTFLSPKLMNASTDLDSLVPIQIPNSSPHTLVQAALSYLSPPPWHYVLVTLPLSLPVNLTVLKLTFWLQDNSWDTLSKTTMSKSFWNANMETPTMLSVLLMDFWGLNDLALLICALSLLPYLDSY